MYNLYSPYDTKTPSTYEKARAQFKPSDQSKISISRVAESEHKHGYKYGT
jgi:hypothetical protein